MCVTCCLVTHAFLTPGTPLSVQRVARQIHNEVSEGRHGTIRVSVRPLCTAHHAVVTAWHRYSIATPESGSV